MTFHYIHFDTQGPRAFLPIHEGFMIPERAKERNKILIAEGKTTRWLRADIFERKRRQWVTDTINEVKKSLS